MFLSKCTLVYHKTQHVVYPIVLCRHGAGGSGGGGGGGGGGFTMYIGAECGGIIKLICT